ncbi:hypothetical protein N473_15885 [Pseudoalteromonas luteoviolacea CPMOR-1]|uniref:Uncharacterized protein n=1 Tax=Pseudoalteromonas luteoviolacea CPMOR-1 TaxID=1365248 RepID=A0A161YPB4_9GAMM|nr:outer membrane protein assembly factor BamE [Pseudoalteromonas luteoviolacea]KZN63797.1 hypothetical protein N473_15885 [Pseudoalteromonas luteoviolacea CPMOR-1]
MKNLLIIFFTTFILAACSSTQSGKDFDMDVVKSFKKGETTQADVREAIGDPSGMDDLVDGETAWQYYFHENKSSGLNYVPIAGAYAGGSKGTSKHVTIRFGKDGIMSGMSFREIESGSSHF